MRLSLICAACGLAVTTLAASSPAKADPYRLVRYSDTGYCLIWDEALPTMPWPYNYVRISATVPNLMAAMAQKDTMLHRGKCSI